MIRVLIPTQKEFHSYLQECKSLYEKVQKSICDTNSFEFIVNYTFFYLFLDEEELIGAIYYFVDENDKLYLNGFAKRKKRFFPIRDTAALLRGLYSLYLKILKLSNILKAFSKNFLKFLLIFTRSAVFYTFSAESGKIHLISNVSKNSGNRAEISLSCRVFR